MPANVSYREASFKSHREPIMIDFKLFKGGSKLNRFKSHREPIMIVIGAVLYIAVLNSFKSHREPIMIELSQIRSNTTLEFQIP